jgi:hypothetical protein
MSDILIIGSGVIGKSLAIQLKQMNPSKNIAIWSDVSPPASQVSIGAMPLLSKTPARSKAFELKQLSQNNWSNWYKTLKRFSTQRNWFQEGFFHLDCQNRKVLLDQVRRLEIDMDSSSHSLWIKKEIRVHSKQYLQVLDDTLKALKISQTHLPEPIDLDALSKQSDQNQIFLCTGSGSLPFINSKSSFVTEGWSYSFPYAICEFERNEILRRFVFEKGSLTLSIWPNESFIAYHHPSQNHSLKEMLNCLTQLQSRWKLNFQICDLKSHIGKRVHQKGFLPIIQKLPTPLSHVILFTGFSKSGFLLSSSLVEIGQSISKDFQTFILNFQKK